MMSLYYLKKTKKKLCEYLKNEINDKKINNENKFYTVKKIM